MKKFLPWAFGIALVGLLGAGCSQPASPAPGTSGNDLAPTSTAMQPSDNLTLTAVAAGPGSVLLKWNKVAPWPKDATIRLLHSGRANPSLPGAYWYEILADQTQATWANIPPGQRHFRLCEYRLNAKSCALYSNDVAVVVK